ncbi:hypothetical protein GEMRC1_001691 [Eukaryota sp. GEM-RC1]
MHKRSKGWINDLSIHFSQSTSIILRDGRMIRLIDEDDCSITLSAFRPTRLGDHLDDVEDVTFLENDVIYDLQLLPHSDQVEIVTFSKRLDLLSLRDVSSPADAHHLGLLLDTSTHALQHYLNISNSEISTFICYPPRFHHLCSRSIVRTNFMDYLENLEEPICVDQMPSSFGALLFKSHVLSCLSTSFSYFVAHTFFFYTGLSSCWATLLKDDQEEECFSYSNSSSINSDSQSFNTQSLLLATPLLSSPAPQPKPVDSSPRTHQIAPSLSRINRLSSRRRPQSAFR